MSHRRHAHPIEFAGLWRERCNPPSLRSQEALRDLVRLTVGLVDINWAGMQPSGGGSLKVATELGIERVVEQAGQFLQLKPPGTGPVPHQTRRSEQEPSKNPEPSRRGSAARKIPANITSTALCTQLPQQFASWPAVVQLGFAPRIYALISLEGQRASSTHHLTLNVLLSDRHGMWSFRCSPRAGYTMDLLDRQSAMGPIWSCMCRLGQFRNHSSSSTTQLQLNRPERSDQNWSGISLAATDQKNSWRTQGGATTCSWAPTR